MCTSTGKALAKFTSAKEAADHVGCCVDTMYRYIRKGRVVHGMTYCRPGDQALDGEVWQRSTLAPGYYVSNMGRVRNVRGRILKQRFNSTMDRDMCTSAPNVLKNTLGRW